MKSTVFKYWTPNDWHDFVTVLFQQNLVKDSSITEYLTPFNNKEINIERIARTLNERNFHHSCTAIKDSKNCEQPVVFLLNIKEAITGSFLPFLPNNPFKELHEILINGIMGQCRYFGQINKSNGKPDGVGMAINQA